MSFKKVSNQIMLITYADSMGKNLKELEEILTTQVKGAIGGLHILPFFSVFCRPGICANDLPGGRSGLW